MSSQRSVMMTTVAVVIVVVAVVMLVRCGVNVVFGGFVTFGVVVIVRCFSILSLWSAAVSSHITCEQCVSTTYCSLWQCSDPQA